MPKPPNEGKICVILDLKRMTKKQEIQLFNDRRIRTIWDDKEEKWYFSVVDVVGALTDSADPRNYWKVLKNRLLKEGNETVTKCNQLRLLAADGKMRLTDIADQEQLFRLIQSIPSPKAEPFKIWMASVASERLDEMQDPELTIERAMTDYRRLGYSEAWINQRLKSIEVRKELIYPRLRISQTTIISHSPLDGQLWILHLIKSHTSDTCHPNLKWLSLR